jgi:hypothetical protein
MTHNVAGSEQVHGYAEGLPQLSADCVISALHSTVAEPRTGTLLLPSAMAVLGVVAVDMFSPRRPQVRNRHFCAVLYLNCHRFTKTGSGQT